MKKKKLFEAYEKANPIKDARETFKNFDLDTNKEKYKTAKRNENIGKGIKIGAICGACVCVGILLIPFSVVFLSGFSIKDTINVKKKEFSVSELDEINKYGVNKLNYIEYKKDHKITLLENKQYVNDVNNFAHEIYINGRENKNFNFAPLSLYMHFDILSDLAGNEYQYIFDSLLGQNNAKRYAPTLSSFENNHYYKNESGTMMFNGLFVNKNLELKNEVLNRLTSKKVEAYSLDFNNQQQVNQMLKWANDRVGGPLVNANDLNIDEMSEFILFNTLYFNNKWRYNFDPDFNTKDFFTQLDGRQVETNFMKHIYFGDFYDYGKYVSAYDYYDKYKIQYLTVKDGKDSIFDLISDRNFLIEDEDKLQEIALELTMPKFEQVSQFDASDVIKKGIGKDLYDMSKPIFNDSFVNENLDNIYLQYTKQHNKISFDEVGTKIKSISFSLGASSAAPLPNGGYKVKLDNPFIYVIKDVNDLPLYIGEYSYVL